MKLAYLDQNKWIQLARVWHRKDDDSRLRQLLGWLTKEVEAGSLSLPLSSVHLIETSRQGSPAKRRRLALVMWTLSCGKTLAGYPEITRYEIRAALAKRFPQVKPADFSLLGYGWHHAFGQPPPPITRAAERLAQAKGLDAATTRRLLGDLIDGHLLAGTDPAGTTVEPYRKDEWARNFEEHLRRLRPSLEELPQRKWPDALRAIALADIAQPILAILLEHGISWEEFMALGPEELGAVLEEMPTRRADIHLHAQVLRNPQLRPRRTDLNDWSALIPAAMYCDAIVCEKHFADLLLREGFNPRAAVVTDIRELETVLN